MIEKIIEIYTESEYLVKPILFMALAASILLDVSRIKVDPWKYLLRKIAGVFNSDIIKAFTDIEHSVGILSEKIEDLENKTEDDECIREGVQALLRAQMIQDYNKWINRGCAPIYARENFENCWEKYHALGANGVMDDLHEKFMELPTKEKEL